MTGNLALTSHMGQQQLQKKRLPTPTTGIHEEALRALVLPTQRGINAVEGVPLLLIAHRHQKSCANARQAARTNSAR